MVYPSVPRCGPYLTVKAEQQPTPDNHTLFQGFEWNVPADQKHWKRLAAEIPKLKAVGVDNVWLPPGCKAASPEGNGYDIYDLYDLGEFDQKNSRSTKVSCSMFSTIYLY